MGRDNHAVLDDNPEDPSLHRHSPPLRRETEPTALPAEPLRALRDDFVERLWQGLVVIALIAAPTSAARALTTGWLPIYSFHLGMAGLIAAVFWYRRRLSVTLKSALLVVVFWSVGLAGLFTFGVLGGSYWWLVLSSLVVSTIYSIRAGVAMVIAVTVVLSIAAIGFITGILHPPVDTNAYATSRAVWISMLLTTVVTPFIVFHAIAAYQTTALALLKEVQEQRDRIARLASHDSLTGLPLMNLAMDRLAMALHSAKRTKSKVALLFIDLDDFKIVNDTAGHEAGDFVLTTIAERLKTVTRVSDTAARIGGDEFLVILSGLLDEHLAAGVAERIITLVTRPVIYLGQPLTVGASIGIGLFPDHGTDARSLRRAADAAMYSAKRRGTNSFAFAEPIAPVGADHHAS